MRLRVRTASQSVGIVCVMKDRVGSDVFRVFSPDSSEHQKWHPISLLMKIAALKQ